MVCRIATGSASESIPQREVFMRGLPYARSFAVGLLATILLLPACATDRTKVTLDDDALETWVKLVMPVRLQILEWTKPVSFVGDGNPDGLELIVAAYDSFDDETKVVGTFHIELETRRPSEHIGTRLAFWPVEIDSKKALRTYLDYPNRFYRFPLQLDEPLRPGRYTLVVRLQLPSGDHLADEYEFEYDGGRAPAVRAG